MKEYRTVSVSVSGPRVVVALRNPPLNIMTIEMMNELRDLLAGVDAMGRLILLRGEGRVFSAGADVKEHLPEKVPDMIRALHDLVTAMFAVRLPIVCAMHGCALGGAFEIGTLADYVIATETCKMGLPEIELGVFPPVAAAWYPAMIGWKRALQVLWKGHLSPHEARELGLVSQVVPESRFESEIETVCRRLESLSLPALRCTKLAAMGGFIQGPFDALTTAETLYVQELMRSSDAVEGLRAFLEKRAPQWTHR